MRSRAFFLGVSLVAAAIAFFGVWFHAVHPEPGDGLPLLSTGLIAGGFAAVAWIEGPAPARTCARCQHGTLDGYAFCTTCGSALS